MLITCYTLFDITHTGVLNRAKPSENQVYSDWLYKRNTQANFDTILQAISLRAQPDVIKLPNKLEINLDTVDYFGLMYKNITANCWTFDFEVQYASAFDDGTNELGALYTDCQGIPMIKCNTEYQNLGNLLDTSKDYRNIFFVKY